MNGAKTVAGYLPFAGTAVDGYDFYQSIKNGNPDWYTGAWALSGLIGDMLGAGAIVKAVKAARAVNRARRARALVPRIVN